MSTTEHFDIAARLAVAVEGDDGVSGHRYHAFDSACPLCRRDDTVFLVLSAIQEIDLLRGAMKADDARLLAAADRVGMTWFGSDTADAMADEILRLRSNAADLIERLVKADAELKRLAVNARSDRRRHLRSKGDGVRLALSYAREYQR